MSFDDDWIIIPYHEDDDWVIVSEDGGSPIPSSSPDTKGCISFPENEETEVFTPRVSFSRADVRVFETENPFMKRSPSYGTRKLQLPKTPEGKDAIKNSEGVVIGYGVSNDPSSTVVRADYFDL